MIHRVAHSPRTLVAKAVLERMDLAKTSQSLDIATQIYRVLLMLVARTLHLSRLLMYIS